MFTGASLVGFVFSALTMHLALEAGARPWLARLLGMLVAMNLAFLLNGRFTFGGLTRERCLPLWAAYMANSGFGNLCNYLVFLALTSSRWPLISQVDVAFVAGAMTAWGINFLGARYLVFGGFGKRVAQRLKAMVVSRPSRRPPSRPEPSRSPVPAPGERGWSRR